MPIAIFGSSAAATGAYQPASLTVEASSVVTSNQYQPPSTNGPRSSSNSSVLSGPSCIAPVTCICSPSAFDR